MTPEQVKYIVIHCSATRADMDIGKAEITAWHKQMGWLTIGYHKVIRRDGTVENGRPLTRAGAHVEGHNQESIGVCLVGGADKDGKPENNFTEDQMQTLALVILELRAGGYGHTIVCGHRDFTGVKKACPSFDVKAWMKQHNL